MATLPNKLRTLDLPIGKVEFRPPVTVEPTDEELQRQHDENMQARLDEAETLAHYRGTVAGVEAGPVEVKRLLSKLDKPMPDTDF